MSRIKIFAGLLSLLVVVGLSTAAGAFSAAPESRSYIVVLKKSAGSPAETSRLHAKRFDTKVSHVYGKALRGYAAKLSADEAKTLARDSNVAYVERDRPGKFAGPFVPPGVTRVLADDNDNLQMNLFDELRVDVDVAVLDSGIDLDHPDLNVVASTNCIDANPHCVDGQGDDVGGHGTWVAGVVGALDDDYGIVGAAPGARLWGVRIGETASGFNMSDLIAGIEWVTDRSDEIEVANMSLLADGPSTALETAIDNAVDAGIVFVAAAGNSNRDIAGEPANPPQAAVPPVIPASLDNVIAVSALADFDGEPGGEGVPADVPPARNCPVVPVYDYNNDVDDTLANFSNFGDKVDLVAPGVCVVSTFPGFYSVFHGTSFASPHVAAAAAILASKDKPQDAADVAAIRQELIDAGNTDAKGAGGWDDDHQADDQHKEPLLDVSDEELFDPKTMPGFDGSDDILGLDALSMEPGRIDIYARGVDNTLKYKRFTTGWSGWESVGGSVMSDPGAVDRGGDLAVVFARNSSNEIAQVYNHPSTGWSSWSSLGGSFNSAPTAVSRSTNLIDLYARDTTNALQSKWHSPSTGWSSWASMGGSFTSAPAAVSIDSGNASMVVRGPSGDVLYAKYTPSTGWSSWASLSQPTGGPVASGPAIASAMPGMLNVFVRGADDAIWHKSWTSAGGWSGWISQQGSFVSDPAAVGTGGGKLSLFAVDSNHDLWRKHWHGSGWSTWQLTR